MPTLSTPAKRCRFIPLNEKAKLKFQAVRSVSTRDFDERLYKPNGNLLRALKKLEASDKACGQTVKLCRETSHPTRRLQLRLFRSVLQCCLKCRAAFGRWDLEENLNGPSSARPRLAKAMVACWSAVDDSIPFLSPGEHERLANAYLAHIDWRIQLLEVAVTKTRADYERKLDQFLRAAIRR